ncbi:hypothetical protein [Streptomyces sp. NPDC058694]|uniref:hypothetical protein n=1 Tax=Streptomyces sp. NPDC058694 TaxID=3346603 RepID=UPI0036485244
MTLPVQLTRRPASLTESGHQQLKAVLDTWAELATAHQLLRDFGDMLTQQTGVFLPPLDRQGPRG